MMMNQDMMKNKTRRRLMRGGRNLLRRSGSLVGDVVEMFK